MSAGRALRVLPETTGQAVGHDSVSFLYWYVPCGIITWMALVADRPARLWPLAFGTALRLSIRDYGWARVTLWGLLCLVAWWVVLLAWSTSWLRPRP